MIIIAVCELMNVRHLQLIADQEKIQMKVNQELQLMTNGKLTVMCPLEISHVIAALRLEIF